MHTTLYVAVLVGLSDRRFIYIKAIYYLFSAQKYVTTDKNRHIEHSESNQLERNLTE